MKRFCFITQLFLIILAAVLQYLVETLKFCYIFICVPYKLFLQEYLIKLKINCECDCAQINKNLIVDFLKILK